ncbi:uncharacterized protein KY384_002328 [Bacidia gigantensis]|uniref:uncharacterized protein n=1 Tax=Bacidia gigantensis TaxID=2732470 RepID=UPI001D04053C|nr:uncharacterized protein KY384_002328 [Bacidia gigantensis]KAG8532451.1 hypothetical protein KY384_002328 [Bacidia gigantensis]
MGQIFGGLVAYGIAVGAKKYGYTMAPWKIVFLVCGLITSFMGMLFLYFVPDNQLNARWLSKQDRRLAIERVRINQQGIGNKHFKMYQVKDALTDPLTWAFVFYALTADIPNGGISNFFSELIVSFGYTPEQSLLYGTPGGAVEVVALIVCGYLGDKFRNRLLVCTSGLLIAIMGMLLIVCLPLSNHGGRLAGYYFTQSSPTPFVALLSLIATNVAGYTKKTTVAALYLIAYCAGNIIGPQTFRPGDAPRYVPAEITIIVCWSACLVDIIFIYIYCRWQNQKKAAFRARPGYVKLENQEWFARVEEENTMTCRMLVTTFAEGRESPILLKPRHVTDASDEIRTSWVNGMKNYVGSESEHEHVRPLDFLFALDGSVDIQAPTSTTSDLPDTYPATHRIPPATIADLQPKEKVRRAELFALGSLIYEIYAGEAPFESLEDDEIQTRYRGAEFPKVTHLPQWPIILACWSVEFARELGAILNSSEGTFKRFGRLTGKYIAAHPVLFGMQCAGTVVGIGAAVALPVLGFAGFGALGPIAGSSAAAWQTSIGVVQGGSLFAWCQSAAMGGAALNGIAAAGATGGIALTSTAAGIVTVDESMEERLMKVFEMVCRKAEGSKESLSKE